MYIYSVALYFSIYVYTFHRFYVCHGYFPSTLSYLSIFQERFLAFFKIKTFDIFKKFDIKIFNFFMLKVSYCAYDYMYFSKAFFMAVLYGFFKIGIFSRFLAFSKIKIFGFFKIFGISKLF